MTAKYSDAYARRIVTGLNADGRSCIVSDANTECRMVTPGNVKNDLWRFHSLPTSFDAGDGLAEITTRPPPEGFLVRSVTFPPDAEWDRSLGYFDANGPLKHADEDDEGIPGLHATDSLDIVTLISGELWCIMQEGEVVMRPGDTLVQTGTKHSWSNRSSEPATIVSIMVATKKAG